MHKVKSASTPRRPRTTFSQIGSTLASQIPTPLRSILRSASPKPSSFSCSTVQGLMVKNSISPSRPNRSERTEQTVFDRPCARKTLHSHLGVYYTNTRRAGPIEAHPRRRTRSTDPASSPHGGRCAQGLRRSLSVQEEARLHTPRNANTTSDSDPVTKVR